MSLFLLRNIFLQQHLCLSSGAPAARRSYQGFACSVLGGKLCCLSDQEQREVQPALPGISSLRISWGKRDPQQNTDQTTVFVLKSKRNQILLSSSSQLPPPPLCSLFHRFQELFCGSFACCKLQTGKINSKWGVQPLGWGQCWRGEDSWGAVRQQGRKARRTQRPVPCTAKTSKCKALHKCPNGVTLCCKDAGRPSACSRATWTQASKVMTSPSSKMTSKNVMENKSNGFSYS